MKFVILNLGCKVNQYEGLSLVGELKKRGFEVSLELEPADIYIVNTCAVTQEAEAKSRRLAARASRLNPHADVIIVGCSSQVNTDNFKLPNAKIIGGSANKNILLKDYLDKKMGEMESYFSLPEDYREMGYPAMERARAYIKIQDGCSSFCNYCIVPYARGGSRSRKLESVLDEIAATDVKEIILTGINISAYNDEGRRLPALINALPKTGKRFRISSLEPNVITEELLSAWKNNAMCPHFHLSMQSGSDRILKAMNRKYTSSDFLGKVDLIRQFFPQAAITTDIIAGFPTETKEEHEETLRTIELANFADMHVFPYSLRKGTPAAALEMVGIEVRKSRAAEISGLGKVMRKKYLESFIGVPMTILIESETVGMTENYIKIYGQFLSVGVLEEVVPQALYLDGMK